MLTITIGRDTLELAPLVITGSRTTTPSGLWIPEDGYEPPKFEPRRSYAPDSDWQPGRALLSAVLDQGVLPLVVCAHRDDETDLAALCDELDAAVHQFVFPIEVEEDDISRSWSADYSHPAWVRRTPQMRLDHRARCGLPIPVNP